MNLSLTGRWSMAQCKAIQASLGDWLVKNHLHLMAIEITCHSDEIPWYLLYLETQLEHDLRWGRWCDDCQARRGIVVTEVFVNAFCGHCGGFLGSYV